MNLAKLEGQTLAGRFRLEAILGQGGYGAVFEAVQLSVGRRCAVKVLFPHLCDDDAAIERFRTEARTTSRLTHPNSVIIYDFGRDEELDLLFLAMELLDGKDLRSVIREKGWMTVEETVHVVSQAAASLQEAHELGLVHRDIKPHNIMLLDRGNDSAYVKVIDFGIAKVVRSSLMTVSDVTQTGTIIGTPKYMSPEQIRDSGVDGRTDMYGLAISAYQMLCGRTPFEEGTALEIAGRQLAEKPEPVRTFRPDLPVAEAFEKVLLKALEKDPDDRFDSVAEFAQALEAAARAPVGQASFDEAPMAQSDATEALSPEALGLPSHEAGLASPGAASAAVVDDYDEITQAPQEGLYGDGLEAPLPALAADTADTAPNPTGSGSAEQSGPVGADDDFAHKTLATLAIPNSARPELGAHAERDGTTAEVSTAKSGAASSEQKKEARSSGSKAPVAVAAALLLVAVLGVGFWTMSTGEREPSKGDATDERVEQEEVASSEPTLTASVAAEPEAVEPKAEAEEEASSEDQAVEDDPVEKEAVEEETVEEETVEEETVEEEAVEEEMVEEKPSDGTEAVAKESSAKPKPAARVSRHKLEVRVIPWGTLYVDGRKVGEGTRHTLRLRSGRRSLVLKQGGQVRARRTVDVSSRSSKIIELVAK